MPINFPLNHDITRDELDFQILSDISLVDMADMPMDTTLVASGFKDGDLVRTDVYGNLIMTDVTAFKNSFFVWQGGRLASDVPYDTVATGKLTVITSAGWLGKTKAFAGSPAVGALLVAKNGVLDVASTPLEGHRVVAVVYAPIADGYLYFKAL